MRYIVCDHPGSMTLSTMESPIPKKGESLLKIHKIGICGTDIHAFNGNQPYFNYPRILGHELAAEYVMGDAENFIPGEALTFMPYFNCGICVACKNERPNCCSNIKVFGVHMDGGMKEYVVVPNEYLLKGVGLSYDQLTMVEPLAIAAHGVRRGGITENDTVLVMGVGPIGLGLVAFAKIKGARVIGVDVNDFRLNFAKLKFGVDACLNPLNVNLKEELFTLTDGDMATVVIDATGNQSVINGGLQYISHGGRYVLVGLQKGDLVFNHPEFHKRETTLLSSRNANKEDFEHVISCLKKGLIDVDSLITHRLNFSNLPELFENISDPKNKIIKAVIDVI